MVSMTIKMKILIPMVLLTILVAAAILVSNVLQFSNYVNATTKDSVDLASSVAEDELEMKKAEAEVTSLSIAENVLILEAIKNKDRDALISISEMMMVGTNMDFCTIADASGVAIARPHAPEKYGDDITAMPSVKSALSGKALATIEPGATVRMSVCAGTPISNDEGKILGVVVVGFRLDTDRFVDSIKSILGCEVTFFLGDERISTTVLKDDGTRAVGTKAAENVSKTVLAGDTYSGMAKILNHNALTKYIPIADTDGKILGMLFVGHFMTEAQNTIWSFIKVGLLIILVVLAVSIFIIMFITGRIVAPIKIMVKEANALAVGDTEINVDVDTKDEMRELANAFNEIIKSMRTQVQVIEAIADGDLTLSIEKRSDKDIMNQALISMLELNNEVFSQIVYSAELVSSGARQMADGSQVLAQGSTEQATTVSQLSGSISEVNAKTKDSAAMAEKAAHLAQTIEGNAQKGSEQMENMVRAVKEIDEASQSINKIIKVIDDIAFQTNILALNAAVEAARAGQHGKGFAVVADEVRNLAAKSAAAAKDTSSLIENSIAKAELGVRIADETAASLSEIVSGIKESGEIVGDIAKASAQQNILISQINDGINQVSHVVQQNSSTAEESAAISQEMSGQAGLLQNLVERFKLKRPSGVNRQFQSSPSHLQATSDTAFSLTAKMSANEGKY